GRRTGRIAPFDAFYGHAFAAVPAIQGQQTGEAEFRREAALASEDDVHLAEMGKGRGNVPCTDDEIVDAVGVDVATAAHRRTCEIAVRDAVQNEALASVAAVL